VMSRSPREVDVWCAHLTRDGIVVSNVNVPSEDATSGAGAAPSDSQAGWGRSAAGLRYMTYRQRQGAHSGGCETAFGHPEFARGW
jgi:hypothetical protein